jgi:hypothetical protein
MILSSSRTRCGDRKAPTPNHRPIHGSVDCLSWVTYIRLLSVEMLSSTSHWLRQPNREPYDSYRSLQFPIRSLPHTQTQTAALTFSHDFATCRPPFKGNATVECLKAASCVRSVVPMRVWAQRHAHTRTYTWLWYVQTPLMHSARPKQAAYSHRCGQLASRRLVTTHFLTSHSTNAHTTAQRGNVVINEPLATSGQ